MVCRVITIVSEELRFSIFRVSCTGKHCTYVGAWDRHNIEDSVTFSAQDIFSSLLFLEDKLSRSLHATSITTEPVSELFPLSTRFSFYTCPLLRSASLVPWRWRWQFQTKCLCLLNYTALFSRMNSYKLEGPKYQFFSRFLFIRLHLNTLWTGDADLRF